MLAVIPLLPVFQLRRRNYLQNLSILYENDDSG